MCSISVTEFLNQKMLENWRKYFTFECYLNSFQNVCYPLCQISSKSSLIRVENELIWFVVQLFFGRKEFLLISR